MFNRLGIYRSLVFVCGVFFVVELLVLSLSGVRWGVRNGMRRAAAAAATADVFEQEPVTVANEDDELMCLGVMGTSS